MSRASNAASAVASFLTGVSIYRVINAKHLIAMSTVKEAKKSCQVERLGDCDKK